MDVAHPSKSNLSKHVLQMKFMQRSALRIQKDELEADQQKYIDDEHWRLDLPELHERECKYILQPSFVYCEELRYGRFSFKGFNPEVEKLMLSENQDLELQRAAEREKEISVGDKEMAQRYTSLVGTIGKKFTKKRHRPVEISDDEDEDEAPKKKNSSPQESQSVPVSNTQQPASRGGKVKNKKSKGRYY